ncbi:MAG TPA: PIN domain-containing protein [archaeon]|nr:PIN domain-containing protein [archaeon]
MKVYLDSNVFISFVRQEMDSSFNMLFQHSDLFFALCKKKKIGIVLSKLFFDEVEKVISLKQRDITETLKNQGLKTVLIEEIELNKEKAKKIMKENNIHFLDAFHVAISIANKCDCIVTWNKKDFEKTDSLIKSLNPSEFLDTF